jgi:adenylate cyclase
MVYRQVRNKVDHTFEDLGDKTVKNIPEPVRVFRILMDEDAASRARAGEGAARGAAVFLPEKPSLAVLPFVNPSGDREQDYFADGLTMEIMTSLIKIPRLFSSRIRRSSPSSRSPFRLGSSAARWEFATCSREACGKRATG